MKLPQKYYRLLFVLMVGLVFVAAYAYAATQLSINNTATITIPNTNLFAIVTGITSTTTCSTQPSTSYTDTGLSISWPSVPQGSNGSVYICLKNTGSGADTLGFTSGALPTGISFASPQQSATLASGGFVLVQLTLTATTTATLGGFSFTLTIT